MAVKRLCAIKVASKSAACNVLIIRAPALWPNVSSVSLYEKKRNEAYAPQICKVQLLNASFVPLCKVYLAL